MTTRWTGIWKVILLAGLTLPAGAENHGIEAPSLSLKPETIPFPLIMPQLGDRARSGPRFFIKTSNTTDRAVTRALDWLKREQQADGSWDEKRKTPMTALALLAYLAHGETPISEQYGATVEKAIKFLLKVQKPDGLFADLESSGLGVYEHALATYAVSECYGMTRIPQLKEAMEDGVIQILKGQQAGGGWDYRYRKGERRDTSVAAWQILALKAACMAGAETAGLEKALKLATRDLKAAYHPPKGTFSYTAATTLHKSMTTSAVSSLQLLGLGDSPEVQGGFIRLSREKMDWKAPPKHALYNWYFATQAWCRKGGKPWIAWQAACYKPLVVSQREDDHWSAPGGKDNPEHKYGPVYSTTLSALMLQVRYRFLPTFDHLLFEACLTWKKEKINPSRISELKPRFSKGLEMSRSVGSKGLEDTNALKTGKKPLDCPAVHCTL